ncbi:dihydrofolate reductase family protein [Streptomyces sp. A3M-1-3]|uniref:dihydrofolate reductase family protein n=1 Tax=Streptomyces sp. A3M-1-3 TaxID=2962044 RepID=UPI0020B739CE|nr:dihydrofolate reductase family protein [Streptomyces sp. A3M-1-3]MCP3821768.1 dihydrofolate reductase family protein [Streptomyces sp. A3M-1-3]
MRKLTYYIAISIDGFIAGPEGEVDGFPQSEEYTQYTRTDYPENVRFDTLVMGRGTYDPALAIGITNPYAHIRTYVASRSLEKSPDPAVEIISGDLVAKVRELKQEEGLGIYLAGGADLAGQLFDEIDELHVKTYPIVLGSGIPMLRTGFSVSGFEIRSSRVFDNGLIFTQYTRKP